MRGWLDRSAGVQVALRRGLPRALGGLALLAAGLMLVACGTKESPSDAVRPPGEIPEVEAKGELGRLVARGNQILDGGLDAYETQLERLRGNPIVVNQWASWCGPCRFEFPFFQDLAVKYGGRVAFLGVDSQDDRDAAETFLRGMPTPYPHYFDPDVEIARSFGGGRAWPTTAFYNAAGELTFTHQGVYEDEDALERDLRQYALERSPRGP